MLETHCELAFALVEAMQRPLFENPLRHCEGDVVVKLEPVGCTDTPLTHNATVFYFDQLVLLKQLEPGTHD